MSGERGLDRRGFLAGAACRGERHLLGGCDPLSDQPWLKRILDSAETLTRVTQRALLSPSDLAREYSEAEISAVFKAERLDRPRRRRLSRLMPRAASPIGSFRSAVWSRSRSHSRLDELRAMPSRTQITRHDCVEGWSCIGKWKGVKLSALLERARLKPEARYIVFYCADDLGETGNGGRQVLRISRAR